MISFQGQYTQCQDIAQDEGADALTFFKTNINVGQHILEAELGSYYTEETYTDLTEASVQSYPTPDQFVRLKIAYVTVSSVRHVMEQIFDEAEWQALLAAQASGTSDIARFIFIRRDRFEVYPKPATAGNTITFIYEASGKDLSFADYTDGTITTLANGAKAVTASGSTFTSAMANRYFKINSYPIWYKIASFGTTTTLTLDKEYTGISIAAGTETYTIGEMPRTPESTHHIPVWYAMMNYYNGFKQNAEKGTYYKSLYESDLRRAKVTYSRRYSSNYIPGRRSRAAIMRNINPNDYPTGLTY